MNSTTQYKKKDFDQCVAWLNRIKEIDLEFAQSNDLGMCFMLFTERQMLKGALEYFYKKYAVKSVKSEANDLRARNFSVCQPYQEI